MNENNLHITFSTFNMHAPIRNIEQCSANYISYNFNYNLNDYSREYNINLNNRSVYNKQTLRHHTIIATITKKITYNKVKLKGN